MNIAYRVLRIEVLDTQYAIRNTLHDLNLRNR